MTTAATDSLALAGVPTTSLRRRVVPVRADARNNGAPEVAALLDRIALLFSDLDQDAEARPRVTAAHARALAIAPTGGRELAVVSFVADLFVASAIERSWSPAAAAHAFGAVAEMAGVAPAFLRTSVCLRALRDPGLLELPARSAIDAILTVLAALARVTEVTLRRDGDVATDAPAAAGGGRRTGLGSLRAVPVLCWRREEAVLTFRAADGEAAHASALAEEAAAVLGLVLERETILERNAARERSLVEASERRLTRLAFDLHDGPIQDLVALTAEVRLLRHAVADVEAGARLDELEMHLARVGGELRELSSSLEPTRVVRSLKHALERQVEAFRNQAEIRAALELAGDFEALTASQRIAVLRIVQEALANVREHSRARAVRVAVAVTDSHISVEVTDDGRGFDVDSALRKAAENGRLGLVGMSERVRLLGGRIDVESRPGGPTTIAAVLRLWQPLDSGARPDVASAAA